MISFFCEKIAFLKPIKVSKTEKDFIEFASLSKDWIRAPKYLEHKEDEVIHVFPNVYNRSERYTLERRHGHNFPCWKIGKDLEKVFDYWYQDVWFVDPGQFRPLRFMANSYIYEHYPGYGVYEKTSKFKKLDLIANGDWSRNFLLSLGFDSVVKEAIRNGLERLYYIKIEKRYKLGFIQKNWHFYVEGVWAQ